MIVVLLALGPVLLFLTALMLMDSFKLVRPRAIGAALAWGGLSALVVMRSQSWLSQAAPGSPDAFTSYLGPLAEEAAKGLFIAVLIVKHRVGFLVDATILGFAVGTGFAVVENLVYLRALGENAPVLLWFVRGLGTAVLHGAATALLAMIMKRSADRVPERVAVAWLPGLIVAVSIHAGFNQVLLPAVAQTLMLLVTLPLLVLFVFQRSERATREWVGAGLDLDVALLDIVESDSFQQTRFGAYLDQLRSRFPGPIVVDMFCLLRIELELSVQAKALVLVRGAGLDLPGDDDLAACLAEREYLLRSIGPTGRAALQPLRVISDRDRWHRHLLRGRRQLSLNRRSVSGVFD